jgi:hypothetical protein
LPGTDEIEQKLDDVVFRLPPGVDLGYLQLIQSPWNEARAFLAVTGTTDQGVSWAADLLADRSWALGSGNLALARAEQVNTIDTHELTRAAAALAMTTAVPEMTPLTTEEAAASPTSLPPSPTSGQVATQQASTAASRPAWIIPLVAITGVVVVAIFAVAFWQTRRNRS